MNSQSDFSESCWTAFSKGLTWGAVFLYFSQLKKNKNMLLKLNCQVSEVLKFRGTISEDAMFHYNGN